MNVRSAEAPGHSEALALWKGSISPRPGAPRGTPSPKAATWCCEKTCFLIHTQPGGRSDRTPWDQHRRGGPAPGRGDPQRHDRRAPPREEGPADGSHPRAHTGMGRCGTPCDQRPEGLCESQPCGLHGPARPAEPGPLV